jgi:hypothetical protein
VASQIISLSHSPDARKSFRGARGFEVAFGLGGSLFFS